jgi:plasmid stabilization system protein ParE
MLRMKSFKKHLIFYRLLPNGAEVIRVIHGARNIEELFEE